MDKRISELRERLYKKKAEARQKENLPVRLEALNRLSPLFILLLLTKSLKWSVICKILYFHTLLESVGVSLLYTRTVSLSILLTFQTFLLQQLNKANGPPSPQPPPGTLGRVAAVGPYIQVPVPGRQEGGYTIPADPLKPQTLGVNNQANQGRAKSGWFHS